MFDSVLVRLTFERLAEVNATLARRLEDAVFLDQAASRLRTKMQRYLGSPSLKTVLSGTTFGHPLHPVLVDIPIGSWTSAMVLDVAAPHSHRASRRLIGVGVLSAIPAMAAGLSDWTDTEGAEARVGLVHAALNTAALSCFTISWWKRRRGGRAGQGWSIIGASMATAAGWLGGHLAYGLGVGVDTNTFETGPENWTDVDGAISSEGEITSVVADDVCIAVFSFSGEPYALGERCSHRGGPLSLGTLEGDCIVCPWHKSKFRLASGLPVRGPAVFGQPVYEVRAAAGGLSIRRSEQRALRKRPRRPARPN